MKKLIAFLLLSSFPIYVFAKPLTLILDWLINPDQAAIFIAQEKHFFEQEGIKVNIIVPADPNDGAKLVAAGQADLAISYQPQLVIQAAQGLPLVRIATLIDKPLNCLLVRKDSGIHSIADLKAKRIAYTSSLEGTWALSALLQQVGLTLHEVHTLNVHYNLNQALLTKRVEAIIGVMRNVEPLQLKSMGLDVKLFPVEIAMPSYDELIMITHKNKLTDPRIKKFLIALQKATDYLLKNPETSWKLFSEHNLALANTLNHDIWQRTLPYLSHYPGCLNKEHYHKFMEFLKEKKVISKTCPTQNYAIALYEKDH